MTPESVDLMSTPCYFYICNSSLLCCDTVTVPPVPLTVPWFSNMYISSCTFCLGSTVLFSAITPSLISKHLYQIYSVINHFKSPYTQYQLDPYQAQIILQDYSR